ncbi:MAG TPA: aspartyl protease family protein [Planctomycetota bacterium]
MKRAWLALSVVEGLVLALAGCGGTSTSSPPGDADAALARGDLAAAEAALRGTSDPEARWTRARLLLMMNRAAEAADILSPLIAKVKSVDAAFLVQRMLTDLAAARARLDDFQGAAQAWAKLGDPVLAKKCDLLSRGPAYRIDAGWTDSILELKAVDPLPLIAARVNGREGLFVVDTGGGEIVLDRAFAKRAGVTPIGTPGGGAAEEAIVDEIAMGRLTVRTVPAQIGEVASRASLKPDGAIGLAFLLHFDVTIDFNLRKLFLKRPGETPSKASVPAYVAGDRYLLVPGKANGAHATLTGIHTGLAGVTAAPSEQFFASRGEAFRDVTAGPLNVVKPPLSPAAFPLGLDGSFGFPVGVVLGPAAFRGRSIRIEPKSMRVEIR